LQRDAIPPIITPEFQGLNPSIEHFCRIAAHRLSDGLDAPNICAVTARIWKTPSPPSATNAPALMRVGPVICGRLEARPGGYLYDRKLVARLRARGDEMTIFSQFWRNYSRIL